MRSGRLAARQQAPGGDTPPSHRRLGPRATALVAAAVVGEATLVWLRAGRPGGWLVVRCRRGHLYRTLWVPGASLTSLRLGWWRLQWCPVGRHVSLVTPVREADLDDEARRRAREVRDLPLP